MRSRCLTIGFVAFALVWSIGCQGLGQDGTDSPLPAPTPAGAKEILYVVDNGEITTYTIDTRDLEPVIAGGAVTLLPTSSVLGQFVASPDDHFLYLLWSDEAQQEHLSTYATGVSGIPQLPAVQTLNVSSLSQLNVHPSGEMVYALEMTSSDEMYTTRILLFNVQPSGMLEHGHQVQGEYGPSLMPTMLYGLSPDGTELYLQSDDGSGPVYWKRKVNEHDGTLAADVLLFRPPMEDSVFLGRTLIIDYRNELDCPQPRYVNVLPNEPAPPRPLIQCSGAMLSACGRASDVQLDPSGTYLFLTDPESQQIRVASINLSKHALTDTGSFLPFSAETPGFAFSPDGTLVYAWLASDLRVHLFSFDRTSGRLVEGSDSIPMSASAGFLPARRR
ncbi:MAG TPA: beta-propeller fold lactonase family protein [Terriglobales bacterium]|nr:beta-propeller fold lactonase family protein [Terriglobales bacterium]